MDFNLAEIDLIEDARGESALTPLKATESKSKFNEAKIGPQVYLGPIKIDIWSRSGGPIFDDFFAEAWGKRRRVSLKEKEEGWEGQPRGARRG